VTISCCGCQTENYRAVSKLKRSILQVIEYVQFVSSYIITDGLKYLIKKLNIQLARRQTKLN